MLDATTDRLERTVAGQLLRLLGGACAERPVLARRARSKVNELARLVDENPVPHTLGNDDGLAGANLKGLRCVREFEHH